MDERRRKKREKKKERKERNKETERDREKKINSLSAKPYYHALGLA